MAFRYPMTDTSRESLERRIDEAKQRGFRQYSEIKVCGNNKLVRYTRLDKYGRDHNLETTSAKFSVIMEAV